MAAICTLLVMLLNSGSINNNVVSDEMRLQSILSQIEGAGKVQLILAKDEKNQTTGALVIADGADDVRVMLELQRAIRTVTGLGYENIEVLKSK